MNIDRRALLKSGTAVSAAMLAPGLAGAALTGPGIERFVFDGRFTSAVAAGRNAAQRGISVSRVDGDLTSLWYEDFSLRWKQDPMTLAGVTAEDVLFVLSTLAPDYQMRVVQRELFAQASMAGSRRGDSLPLYSWLIAPRR